MKKIAFVHTGFTERMSVMTLSAYFKKELYDCRVFILTHNAGKILNDIQENNPDILGLSAFTSECNDY